MLTNIRLFRYIADCLIFSEAFNKEVGLDISCPYYDNATKTLSFEYVKWDDRYTNKESKGIRKLKFSNGKFQ